METNERKLVTIEIPIGELVDRGMEGVYRISIDGVPANGITAPYKNGDGKIVCNKYFGSGGFYVVDPETIAVVEMSDPDEKERQFQEKNQRIRDLIAKYAPK